MSTTIYAGGRRPQAEAPRPGSGPAAQRRLGQPNEAWQFQFDGLAAKTTPASSTTATVGRTPLPEAAPSR
ncbi:MAG TPA: hypothetical protein VIT42_02310 [Microlunatus sp.]